MYFIAHTPVGKFRSVDSDESPETMENLIHFLKENELSYVKFEAIDHEGNETFTVVLKRDLVLQSAFCFYGLESK